MMTYYIIAVVFMIGITFCMIKSLFHILKARGYPYPIHSDSKKYPKFICLIKIESLKEVDRHITLGIWYGLIAMLLSICTIIIAIAAA